MSRLMRTSEVTGRPVVTLGGEDIAQIKDVVYSAGGGAVGGFTLAGRGLFSGPLKQALPWAAVIALGPDAVMIRGEDVLEPNAIVLDQSATSGGSGGDVLGSKVLTDGGTELGTVVDVILETSDAGGGQCDVVGYEVEASEALGTRGTKVFIPLPDTLAASREHLMVPESAADFVANDLAGFGAAARAFRQHLEGPR
ncbi:MAG: PRC-barrel domain-containing protein [Dermatophilaceae bacterium]